MNMTDESDWKIQGEIKVGDRLINRYATTDEQRDHEIIEIDRGTYKLHSATGDQWTEKRSLIGTFMRDLRENPPPISNPEKTTHPSNSSSHYNFDQDFPPIKPEPYKPMF